MQPTKKVSLSFDIEVSKNGEATIPPEIKMRLETNAKPSQALTLQEIDEKLQQAAEKRQQAIDRQCSAAKESIEKLGITRERKLSQDRAQEEREAAELQQRMTSAEEKRIEQLQQIQEKARTHNTMVLHKVELHQKTVLED